MQPQQPAVRRAVVPVTRPPSHRRPPLRPGPRRRSRRVATVAPPPLLRPVRRTARPRRFAWSCRRCGGRSWACGQSWPNGTGPPQRSAPLPPPVRKRRGHRVPPKPPPRSTALAWCQGQRRWRPLLRRLRQRRKFEPGPAGSHRHRGLRGRVAGGLPPPQQLFKFRAAPSPPRCPRSPPQRRWAWRCRRCRSVAQRRRYRPLLLPRRLQSQCR
mmetsp:Transcript_40720/g.89014  ORF Transcript_40720/g.89014 Transcript_40720/m.89014 type:complete len:213 (+) Transcript_40720:106-744(+)